MLATSPSPRVTPASSPTLNDSTAYLRGPQSQTQTQAQAQAGRTKSASPIVKARSTHVYSYSSTSTSNTSTTANTASQINHPPNSSQCYPSNQRLSFQPQPSQSSPRLSHTASRGTQTLPSRLEPEEPKVGKVQMVDAQTQYSPPHPQPSRFVTTPATQIAALQLQGSTSSSSVGSSTSTSSIPRRKPFDPVADAAMTAALSGTAISSFAPSSSLGRHEPSSQTELQLQRVPSSAATKRNHSASDEVPQTSTALQNATAPRASNSSSENILSTPSLSKKMRPQGAAIRRLPEDYSLCPPRDLVVLISSMLLDLIHFNDAIPLRDGQLTRFHSRAPPGISVLDYLQRLTTHATLLPPILLSMVFYIDRLCALYPAFTISSLTVHRFLITSATVASKGLSDSFWTNKTYAKVGGVSVRELALLEMELLTRVGWRIVPQQEVLVDYYKSLVARTEGYELEELTSDTVSTQTGDPADGIQAVSTTTTSSTTAESR